MAAEQTVMVMPIVMIGKYIWVDQMSLSVVNHTGRSLLFVHLE